LVHTPCRSGLGHWCARRNVGVSGTWHRRSPGRRRGIARDVPRANVPRHPHRARCAQEECEDEGPQPVVSFATHVPFHVPCKEASPDEPKKPERAGRGFAKGGYGKAPSWIRGPQSPGSNERLDLWMGCGKGIVSTSAPSGRLAFAELLALAGVLDEHAHRCQLIA
jgi:hypothetical protein